MLLIQMIIGFSALAFASASDLKKREVADWLNFSLIAAGLGVGTIYSLYYLDYTFILGSLLGLGLSMMIGYGMYYTGQWGGGDAKMLMGLGALIGLSFGAGIPFLISMYVNILFMGAIYGLLWVIALGLLNSRDALKKASELLKSQARARLLLFAGSGALILVAALSGIELYYKLLFIALVALLVFVFYLWVIVRAVEEVSMIKRIAPEKLTEGDWIVDSIATHRRIILLPKILDRADIEAIRHEKLSADPVIKVIRRYLSLNVKRSIWLHELKQDDIVLEKVEALGYILKKGEKVLREHVIAAKKHIKENTLLDVTAERKLMFFRKGIKNPFSLSEGDRLMSPLYKANYVAGPRDLGIEREQIAEILELKSQRRLKTVRIKNGIPFIPSFLLGFAYTIIFKGIFIFSMLRIL